MSIWDDQWEDYEKDKHDFEAWLDSINPEGDPEMDEKYYNEVQAKEWEKWLEENEVTPIEQTYLENNITEYPEYTVLGSQYILTVSDN